MFFVKHCESAFASMGHRPCRKQGDQPRQQAAQKTGKKKRVLPQKKHFSMNGGTRPPTTSPVAGGIGEVARPRLDERPDHVRVSVRTRLVQRRVPVSVLMVRVNPASEDDLDVFQLAVPAC